MNKKVISGGVAAIIAAALPLALPLIEKWEGLRTKPYRDVVGVETVCFGETNVTMRQYSPEECRSMLRRAVADRYATPVLNCVPGLAERPGTFAAAMSLAYNIGPTAFCRSTAARLFNQGDWVGGCRQFERWVYAGGRKWKGLVNRRRDEVALCLRGV